MHNHSPKSTAPSSPERSRARSARGGGLCAAVFIGCAGLLFARSPAGLSPAPASAVRSELRLASETTASANLKLSSCASCHGVAANDAGNSWKSAYHVWSSRDPHAGAYATLWNGQSKQIVSALAGALAADASVHQAVGSAVVEPETYQRILNDRCVVCHSSVPPESSIEMANSAEGIDRNNRMSMSNGVNCHSCHSEFPLDRPGKHAWVVAHTQQSWNAANTDKQALGLVKLSNANERARTCVRCHVGSAGMEVNHDLIAAGHPRLVFEYASSLDRLPKHWDEAKPFGYRASNWSAGQTEASTAALRLLSHRASRAGDNQAPWPELAEYHCHSCHHRFDSPWYLPLDQASDAHTGHDELWQWSSRPPVELPNRRSWDKLRQAMATGFPEAERIQRLVSAIDDPPSIDPHEHLIRYLTRAPALNSDAVFAWYLAARVAWQDALANPANAHAMASRDRTSARLSELRSLLSAPFADSLNTHPDQSVSAEALRAAVLAIQESVLPALQRNHQPLLHSP